MFFFINIEFYGEWHTFICFAFLMETYYPFSTVEVDYIFFRAEGGKCLFVCGLFFVQP